MLKPRHVFLVLALFAALNGDSFARSHRTPAIKSQQQQTQSQQQQAAPDQRGTEQQPLIVQPLPTKKSAGETRREEQEAERKTNSDWWNWFLSVLTVGALFGQAAILAAQAYFLGGTLKAADTAASAAQDSIDLAREEFISSHRPRIIVRALDFVGGTPESDEVEGPIRIGIHYVNAGDSLAIVKEVGTKLVDLFKPTMPTGITFDVDRDKPPLEVKSGRHAFRITIGAFDQEKFIFNSAADGYSLVCVGYIVYSDESGTDRQMGFCRRLDGESNRWLPMDDPEYEYSY